MNPKDLLKGYDPENFTIGVLGGHSALDVCRGAKKQGFGTVCIARKGREQTYNRYFKTRPFGAQDNHEENDCEDGCGCGGHQKFFVGCVDHCEVVDSFEDALQKDIQEKLRKMNTIFIHNRYFWVYFKDYGKIENDFHIPIFGNRSYVKIEERDQEYNQYHLLKDAGIRAPKIFSKPSEIDRLCIVKAAEAARGYERAFFFAFNEESYEEAGTRMEKEGKLAKNWRTAPIEEFIIGAPVNFNFFFSPLSGELELMGTDTRRQTNLEGFLRMPAPDQVAALERVDLKMIETGHIAVTVKESLIEKVMELGEKFVAATKKIDGIGIIGPFALQGAVVAEDGKEDIVIFDVSMRIPGSPGTMFTPYSGYLWGASISYGDRIALEIRRAVEEGRLEEVVT